MEDSVPARTALVDLSPNVVLQNKLANAHQDRHQAVMDNAHVRTVHAHLNPNVAKLMLHANVSQQSRNAEAAVHVNIALVAQKQNVVKLMKHVNVHHRPFEKVY